VEYYVPSFFDIKTQETLLKQQGLLFYIKHVFIW